MGSYGEAPRLLDVPGSRIQESGKRIQAINAPKIWLARGGMYSRYSVLHRRKSRQWSGAQTLNTVSNEPGFLFSPELFILPVINLELHAAVLRERTIRDYKHPNVLL